MTSKTPGKTNHLHFLETNHLTITIVDCPGYGFAQRSEREKKEWRNIMEKYFQSPYLKKVFILVDSEVGITKQDENCLKTCHFAEKEFVIVFTKIDKFKKNEKFAEIYMKSVEIIRSYNFYSQFVFLTSSK